MLWTLLKFVLFVVIVAALAVGADRLMEADGAIRVVLGNTEFTLGPLQAVIAVILLIVAVWVVLKLLGLLVALVRFLNGDETALSRHFSRSRERKGYQALADGMLALASGEGREALSKAERADRLLHRPELTSLITAQAAEMIGDKARAEATYKRLLQDERTRFVGIRGLLQHKLQEGDTDTALKLAEKAFALKPKNAETQDTLLRLQAGKEDWTGARRTLGAKLKHGTLPRDVHKRRDAVLAASQARDILDEGQTIEAREKAIEANRLSPDLIPAAVMAARGYIENKQQRYATRVIKKAWEIRPHPDLASVFAEIVPDETPEQRLRRFSTLTRIRPDDPETRMLLAELNIAAEDFPAARRALGDLATTHPTARSVTIMAAIERGEGADDAVVRGWLTRALSVSRGPQWICENCHNIEDGWKPICGNCGAFDTLSWREPQSGVVAMPSQSAMLPLIVGRDGAGSETLPAERGEAPRRAPEPAGERGPAAEPARDGQSAPDVGEERRQNAVSVPEAEVIVPQEQRDEAAARN